MTAEEVAAILDISVNTLKGQYKRVVEKAEKEGYKLIKNGRGKTTTYKLTQFISNSLFEEKDQEINIKLESLSLEKWELTMLLVKLINPKVFNWSLNKISTYIGYTTNSSNTKKIEQAIKSIENNENAGEIIKFNTSIIKKSKELAEKHDIRDWQNIFKVYISILYLKNKIEIITYSDINSITNLSHDVIYKCIKLDQELFKLVKTNNKKNEKNKQEKGIYGIYIKNELVYIGKTNTSFDLRWYHHERCVKDKTIEIAQQEYLYKAMRENEYEFKILVKAQDWMTDRDIQCMEYALITTNKPKYNYLGVKAKFIFNFKEEE